MASTEISLKQPMLSSIRVSNQEWVGTSRISRLWKTSLNSSLEKPANYVFLLEWDNFVELLAILERLDICRRWRRMSRLKIFSPQTWTDIESKASNKMGVTLYHSLVSSTCEQHQKLWGMEDIAEKVSTWIE